MNWGIHDEIHYVKSKFNTKPLLEVRVHEDEIDVRCDNSAQSRVKKSMNDESKKSINCFISWSDFA